jgi:hypothetical protein
VGHAVARSIATNSKKAVGTLRDWSDEQTDMQKAVKNDAVTETTGNEIRRVRQSQAHRARLSPPS